MAGWRPRNPYTLLDEEAHQAHVAGGVAAVEAIVHAEEIPTSLQRQLLNVVTWYATEHPHKYRIRWRSAKAVAYRGKNIPRDLRHEHVLPRKWLIDALAAHPDRAPQILRSAVACLVHKTEAKRLDQVDDSLLGWERYRAAGLEVLDMGDGRRRMPIDELVRMYPVPEL